MIDQDGYIATNKHVVEHAIAVFAVTNDSVRHPARVIGTTFSADIALIKVDGWKDMPFVSLGDSDKLAVGERVVAIGSPFGFVGSASTGIVSAVNRDIMESPFDDYIQTDAAINHGNSGGPLFNAEGEVVGMTSVIIAPGTGSVGLGFAIPSNDLRFVITRMKANNGKVGAGMLPLRTQPVTWMLAQAIGITDLSGALVAGLDDNGDRMLGGHIKPGDLIVAFNGQQVWDPRDLARKAAAASVGSDAELDLQRGSQRMKVHVKIQAYPEDPAPASVMHKPGKLGLTMVSVPNQGVTVTDIDMMGAAADSGIQKGDVILQVQQNPVSDPDQAMRLIEQQGRTIPAVCRRSWSGARARQPGLPQPSPNRSVRPQYACLAAGVYPETKPGFVLAPQTTTPTRAPGGGLEPRGQQGRHGGGAAGFGDQAEPLPQQPLRRRDCVIGHQHGLADEALGDREHQRRRPALPPGCRRPARRPGALTGWPASKRVVQRRAALRLDADDCGAAGIPGRDSTDQAAAAGRDQDMGQVRRVLFELPPHRALAGQHIGMVIGVDLQRPGLRLPLARCDQCLGIAVAHLDHAGAIAGDPRDLGRRGCRRARRSPPSCPGCAPRKPPPRHDCRRMRRSPRRRAMRLTAGG